jgi:hypothetical protein
VPPRTERIDAFDDDEETKQKRLKLAWWETSGGISSISPIKPRPLSTGTGSGGGFGLARKNVPKGWGWDQVERKKRVFQYPAPPSVEQHIAEDVRLRRSSREASPGQQVPKSYRSGRQQRREGHAAAEDDDDEDEEGTEQYFDQNNNNNFRRNKPASAVQKGRPHSAVASAGGGNKPGHQRPLDNFAGKSDGRMEYVGENGGKKLRIPSLKQVQDELRQSGQKQSGQKEKKTVRDSEVSLLVCVCWSVCVCVCLSLSLFLSLCVYMMMVSKRSC